MYSRKTGTLYNEAEVKRKIDSFNNDLREQYRHRQMPSNIPSAPQKSKEEVPENTLLGMNESIIIIGLIILLLGEENKDYLLIGVLALLLFLNK